MVRGLGFEPRLAGSEPAVLPLDDPRPGGILSSALLTPCETLNQRPSLATGFVVKVLRGVNAFLLSHCTFLQYPVSSIPLFFNTPLRSAHAFSSRTLQSTGDFGRLFPTSTSYRPGGSKQEHWKARAGLAEPISVLSSFIMLSPTPLIAPCPRLFKQESKALLRRTLNA